MGSLLSEKFFGLLLIFDIGNPEMKLVMGEKHHLAEGGAHKLACYDTVVAFL